MVTQGFAFLSKYRAIRGSEGPLNTEEVDYNLGRGFQQLGLQAFAQKHYQAVLESVEKRQKVDPNTPTCRPFTDHMTKKNSKTPFLLSLRDSLEGCKDKFKRLLHRDSEIATQSNPASNSNAQSLSSPEPTSTSAAATIHPPEGNHVGPLDTTIQAGAPQDTHQGKWAAIRSLLATLESNPGAFGPIFSVINMMKGCIDIYEGACKERKEHKDLAMKLERTLTDLAEYMKQPIGSDMSNSVKRIYCDLEDEAKKVSEKQATATGRRMIDALEGSDGILEAHRRIDDHLGRLSRSANMLTLSSANRQEMDSRLDRMSPAKSAMYNSAESHDIKRGSCAPQTREVQIRLLLDWACTPESGRTCWINGMAGTGKTTIAHTVCTKLDEACALGASFFCSRVIPECRQAKQIIPSIAYQLARFSVTFHHALDKVLQSDPDTHTRTLDKQYKKLIVEPLLQTKGTLPADFIVVIDALDECENEETVGQILDLILSPETIHHGVMAEACLRTIDATEPKFNICALPSSYLYDWEVPDLEERISRSISPGLTYACQYWSTHLKLSKHRDELIDGVRNFFLSRLLLWMEVVNLANYLDLRERYASIIRDAERWCGERNAPEDLIRLAHDAWEFVSIYFGNDVCFSTPHIYVSMLAFWPRHRPISTAYIPRTSGLVEPTGTAIHQREVALKGTWRVSKCEVDSINVSGNGNLLVAVTGHSIEVIDATTGAKMFSIPYDSPLTRVPVAMSPDGTKVAVGDSSSTLCIWSIGHGDSITNPLPDDTRGVESIVCSADGSRIACGLKNGDVYIYGLQQEAFSRGPLKCHTSSIWSAAFAPNNLHLASASEDNTVQIWDVQTGQRVGEPLEGRSSHVMSMSYFIDGPRLAFASQDLSVRVWNPQTRRDLLGPLTGHSSPISFVAFSPNGAFVASASSDGIILVHDAHSGQIAFAPLNGHTDSVNSVIFSIDSARLFSSSNDGTVRMWNIQDLNPPDTQSPTSVLSAILSIRYSHDGLRVVSGSKDGAVHVWDVRTGDMVLGPLRSHDWIITSVDYSPKDVYIASGSYDKTVRIWDASTGQDIHGPMRGHDGWVNCVRFSPDNLVVFSGSSDGTIRIWDVSTGQQLAELFRGNLPIQSVGISPDGQRVVCGSLDGSVRVIDRNTGDTLLGLIKAYPYGLYSIDFSPNGMRLVSGSDDSPKIWDAQTGEQPVVCGDNHVFDSRRRNSVSFSPNDLYVASGSKHQTVCVRGAQNGKLILGPLKGHTDNVIGVRFSPDGSHIASCSRDKTIRFWDVSILEKNLQQRTDMGGGRDPTSAHSDNIPHSWSNNDDDPGWLLDSCNQRLLWVPPDLRASLVVPPMSLVIAHGGSCWLKTDGWKIGDKWTDCYRP
ncbi:putative WD repeat-containing protein alr3466 OS=Nostoc sp, (strain PCC 7120 / UTEX 2576) GN=alr3466 PE=4 SV=1 [Rhizoctonia solani AG-1 IB]|uniref:Putative WD repeat-containing protein alr3466 n=1 Tax=Thanatephorus cucumeris (strain AG1-IB / isolate 7/3/14) TaxID=1108050 RepID=A0A0B7FFN9_THACB|nr:putative WD repeat-containing protein alr3466 OS=Nostoc sp, (strain PCC 7120 / UTEX 2576) GN=alr3466 PE=4 SV=1 [Rhizoctonia solani AG-1 IB]